MEISVASEVNSIFSGLELSESISGSNPIKPRKRDFFIMSSITAGELTQRTQRLLEKLL
jgi:hypothetical protein